MDDSNPLAARPVTRFGPFAIVVYGLLTLVVLYAAFLVLRPFLTPLLLALVVVTLTYGMYDRLTRRFGGRRNLAASVMLLFITLVLVIPTAILIFLLVDQASTLFQRMQASDVQQFMSTLSVERRLATLQRWLPWLRIEQVRLDEAVRTLVGRLPAIVATQGSRVLAGFFGVFIGFLLMLLGSFVFYTNGAAMLRELRALSPLPDEYDDHLFGRFRGVVDATFRGQFLTAIAQGFVAGIGLAIAGVPAPIFWGAIAAVFSLIPMVGAAAVWVPSSIYLVILASQGSIGWWRPIFLIAWGVLVVSTVDNFVRPLVMRSGVNMHPIILFFAILGGIQAFGVTGLFLGPLIFVLLVTLTEIYKTAIATGPDVIQTGAATATEPPGR